MANKLTYNQVVKAAQAVGLELVGVTDAGPLGYEHIARLAAWQGSGKSGTKRYLTRDATFRADPARIIPGARSIISVALPYYRGPFPAPPGPGYGMVARYAWGRDYHKVLPPRLIEFHRHLEALCGRSIPGRDATDATPLLERALAERAGLGFFGRNTLLIRPGLGSFFLLAELVLSVPVEESALAIAPDRPGRCGSCVRCVERCPTGAIEPAGVVDARRCISYLTIERTGEFEPWECQALGGWLFGCDICQEVCPFNYKASREASGALIKPGGLAAAPLAEFAAGQGVGPWLSLSEIFSLTTPKQFHNRFVGTPLLRARRAGLIRNALCVAKNTGFTEAIPNIERLAVSDPSPVVRATACWALNGLLCDVDQLMGSNN